MPTTFSSLFYGPVPPLPACSIEQTNFLRQQVIQETKPGLLLRDFQTALEFIGAAGIEVNSTHHLLCPQALADLNDRLSQPIALTHKRPQQKCYPVINGLYLLLRATGLALVEVKGKQSRLGLDPIALANWQRLNPTERYFTLLEAWLIWGNDEILGEPLNLCRRFFDNLGRCLILWQYIPDAGLLITEGMDQQEFSCCPGWHNLALLELFGLLKIQSDHSSGKGWRIQALQRSRFGDALIRLLGEWAAQELQRIDDGTIQNGSSLVVPSDTSRDRLFGSWQPLLQPLFPEWQQTLDLPQQEFRDGVYTFKVSLCKIWRRIVIPGSASLDDLSGIILRSVDFDESQLYCFSFKNRFGWTLRVNHPLLQEGPYTHRYRVGDLPLTKGSRLMYLFDFGEQWEFDIKLERIDPPNPDLKQPKITACYGEPPEQYPTWEEDSGAWDTIGDSVG
jgi:hypothetical protein